MLSTLLFHMSLSKVPLLDQHPNSKEFLYQDTASKIFQKVQLVTDNDNEIFSRRLVLEQLTPRK